VVNTVESLPDIFLNLPNSASFHIIFDDKGSCILEWLGKKYLKDSMALNPVLLTWIWHSEK